MSFKEACTGTCKQVFAVKFIVRLRVCPDPKNNNGYNVSEGFKVC
jgi:hypothetical protein